MLYQLLEDDAGDFWIGTNKSVVRVSRASLDAVADGRRPAARGGLVRDHRSPDGRGGLGASASPRPGRRATAGCGSSPPRGAVSIDPRRVRTNPVRPPVVIEAVLVDGRPLPTIGRADAAPRPRRLEVHYAARTLLEPSKVRYRYRLEGHRSRLGRGGRGRGGRCTRTCRPGPYRFHVQASNNDGLWNEAGATLAFARWRRPSTAGPGSTACAPGRWCRWPAASTGCGWRACAPTTSACSPSAPAWRASCTTPSCRGCPAIAMQLRAIRARLSAGAPEQPAPGAGASCRSTVARCLEETRRAVWDLRDASGAPGDSGPGARRFARRLFRTAPHGLRRQDRGHAPPPAPRRRGRAVPHRPGGACATRCAPRRRHPGRRAAVLRRRQRWR